MSISETYASIECRETRAKKLNNLLTKLAKTETDKDLRIAIKDAIKQINRKIFGHTLAEIKTIVTDLLNEYYSMDKASLTELSQVHPNQLNFVLELMEEQGLIKNVRQRRWQEAGKHYFDLYELVK